MAGHLTSERARELGKIGGKKKKGHKHNLTLLKESIGIRRTEAIIEKLEENIQKAINDPKLWFEGSKAFAEYYKPKRSQADVRFKGQINLIANPKIIGPKKEDENKNVDNL